MDEGADKPGGAGVERGDEVLAASRAIDIFVDALEDFFDLLVQFGAVGDDQDTSILHVLANPLGEPDHRQALAAPLRMPDDATFAFAHPLLRCPYTKVLIGSTELLYTSVEDDKVVNDL